MRRIALFLAAVLCCSTSVLAQDHVASVGTAVAAQSPATALSDMLDLLHHDLIPAAKAMPADKYSFKPTAATFASTQKTDYPNSIRTFAQQIAHITQANYYFFSTISGAKPPVDVKAIGALTDKDQLIAALEASFVYAHQSIATITNENAFYKIEGADGMHTRTTVAGFAVAHGFDHFGQIVEYLRMNGYSPAPAM